MERESLQVTRAKRRYKALLREQALLRSADRSDPVVEEEISKLEEDFPELPSISAEGTTPLDDEKDAPAAAQVPASTASSGTEDNVGSADPSSRSPCSTPSAQPTSQIRLRKSAPPSLLMQAPQYDAKPRSVSAGASSRRTESARAVPAAVDSYFTVVFALQLFNEKHQKSMMSRLSVLLIAALSVAAAAAHCTIIDPASSRGALLSPSLLTLFVHANALSGLYVRRRRRFTAPMLIVYGAFDIIPSLGLSCVCYNLGLIVLEFYGFRMASYAC